MLVVVVEREDNRHPSKKQKKKLSKETPLEKAMCHMAAFLFPHLPFAGREEEELI